MCIEGGKKNKINISKGWYFVIIVYGAIKNYRSDFYIVEVQSSLGLQCWICWLWGANSPAHETHEILWPFHTVITRPRWTCHIRHTLFLLKRKSSNLLYPFFMLFSIVLEDLPFLQTVSVLSSGCSGVRFILFTIDCTWLAFVFLDQQDTEIVSLKERKIEPS